ncbi:MAG: tRNA (guanosine(37)-N1)-methyltransferase TrmD [Candidatus Nanopelagicales bacterium]
MRIDVVTAFPGYLAPLQESIVGRAIDAGIVTVAVHDPRDATTDRHRTVDDAPFGGGPGMVMMPEPWAVTLDPLVADDPVVVVPTPSGTPFTQRTAEQWAGEQHLVIACGRYEGIDARVWQHYRDRGVRVAEVSIGDYVLAGGEVAALVMIEAVTRLIPGVLGNDESAADDSFGADRAHALEGPVYTRPREWRGLTVPDVLLSGDHARIKAWRDEQSAERTRVHRPDLG